MQTNLRIKSISNADGKSTVTDNITYVNPNLSDANAKLLAMKINALTLNAYDTTERIDTRDLDTDSKTDRTLTLKIQNAQTSTSAANVTLDLSQDTFDIPLSYIQTSSTSSGMSLGVPANETSRLFLSNLTGASLQWNQLNYNTTYTSFSWRFTYEQITEPFTVSFTLNLPNNNLYNAWEKSITINFVNGGEG